MRHEMLTQRALFCHRANTKRGTLTQHFVTHVVPPLHSNTAAVVAIGLESVKSRVLGLKLGFLQRVLDGGAELVSGRVVESCEEGVQV